MFIYGGYGYFDNMNTYFNGNDYRVIDRTQFAKSSIVFENIWGVADEVLFNNALPYLDGAATIQRPFFAHIMTTSNHRPFTYPDGRIDIPSPGGREGAIKYTDYAIGQFIDRARQKPWFKDTLFVIVADHCASVAGKTKLPMDRYRIPLIFYAPDLLASGTYPRLISQIDVPPTLLEVLGVQGASHFFGQSVFEAEGQSERAFISNYQQLGYYRESILTVLSPKQQVAAYHIDPETFEASPTKINKRLMKETIAYYQTAARAFKNGDLKYY
jgi:phosphoglycerol transferase MdoB-like AlkP superfamily enzyme